MSLRTLRGLPRIFGALKRAVRTGLAELRILRRAAVADAVESLAKQGLRTKVYTSKKHPGARVITIFPELPGQFYNSRLFRGKGSAAIEAGSDVGDRKPSHASKEGKEDEVALQPAPEVKRSYFDHTEVKLYLNPDNTIETEYLCLSFGDRDPFAGALDDLGPAWTRIGHVYYTVHMATDKHSPITRTLRGLSINGPLSFKFGSKPAVLTCRWVSDVFYLTVHLKGEASLWKRGVLDKHVEFLANVGLLTRDFKVEEYKQCDLIDDLCAPGEIGSQKLANEILSNSKKSLLGVAEAGP